MDSLKRNNDLSLAHPKVRIMGERFDKAILENELPFARYEVFRTKERSDMLYKKGTGVKGGYSYHNYGCAIDYVGLDDAGDWSWDSSLPWEKLAVLGESIGFEAGRRFPGVDSPHFQYTFGISIYDMKNGKLPPVYDKYMEWGFQIGLVNKDNLHTSASTYEVEVMLNRFEKHLLKEYNLK